MRLAAAQATSLTADVQGNLATMSRLCSTARATGVDVLVFPELFVTGYDAGEAFERLAESRDSSIFKAVSAIASQCGIAVCYGYAERDGDDVYNAAVLVGRSGALLLHHRKTQLYGEYERRYFSQGESDFQPVEYLGLRFALLVCYEIEFPEPARVCALGGAEVLLVPTAIVDESSPDGVSRLLVRARAAENNLYVVYANHADRETASNFNGHSLIAGPLGRTYAEIDGRGERCIHTVIDPEAYAASDRSVPYLADLERSRYWRL